MVVTVVIFGLIGAAAAINGYCKREPLETRGDSKTYGWKAYILEFEDWIEITLKDSEGNPIPNAEYIVYLPDGQERQGTLDGNGYARVDNIEPGSCQISFPDLDQEAWEPA